MTESAQAKLRRVQVCIEQGCVEIKELEQMNGFSREERERIQEIKDRLLDAQYRYRCNATMLGVDMIEAST